MKTRSYLIVLLGSLMGTGRPLSAQVLYTPSSSVGAVTNGSSGVGVGTTAPTAKLDVQGGNFRVADVANGPGAFVKGASEVAYFGAEDARRASLGNSESWETLTVDGGKVGIGTSTPSRKLDVNSDLGVTFGEKFIANFSQNAGQNGLYFGYRANGSVVSSALIRADNNLPITFGTSSANEAVTIVNSGNVGIGTSTPSQRLHVYNGGGAIQQFGAAGSLDFYCAEDTSVSPSALSAGRQIMTLRGWGYNGSSYVFSSSIDFQAESAWSAGNTPTYIRFRTSTAAGAIGERMRIDSGGNIGIGTSTPGARLEVKGDELRIRSIVSKTDATPRGLLRLTSDDSVGATNLEMLFSLKGATVGGARYGQIQVGDNGYYWGSLILNPYGGNVGVNTATPTHPLSVNGTIRAKEVIVDTGWSDYVFADDYRLAPLSEVESHIKAQRHLPGIPSAKEVAEHGVSMGDMQSKLLAKIEELTLHQIAQQKDISALKNENAQLRQQMSALVSNRPLSTP